MIKYSLACDQKHSFEAWFRNSDDYEKQKQLGFVTCPVCQSASVEKQLMAPNVSTSRNQKKAQAQRQQEIAAQKAKSANEEQAAKQPEKEAATPAKAPLSSAESTAKKSVLPAMGSVSAKPQLQETPAPLRELMDKMREFRQQATKNADYVGDAFAEEARKIHYGESEARGIYGETTVNDAKELMDEGIGLVPLPTLPEDKN
ncbi:DUF1178 family protein [Polycladidibacter stylochi]|uniref:DUF1178 family protein n=1 Tax=Polycladidibacter stylochi TaxID=1807766 RepID=UPI000832AE09|nr:DUF1178 family protein [Pseudovibrio stylochi]